MTPTHFPQVNVKFKAPSDLADSQCLAIPAWRGSVNGGSVDGVPCIVTAWKPDADELARINAGEPIFLTFCGEGLPPHMVSTDFHTATHPA